MKIRDVYTNPISRSTGIRRSGGTGDVRPTGEVPQTDAMDRVHLSEQSAEVQRARALALRAPDIREDLVDQLIREIGEGRYRVVGAQVVDKMIRDHLQLITH